MGVILYFKGILFDLKKKKKYKYLKKCRTKSNNEQNNLIVKNDQTFVLFSFATILHCHSTRNLKTALAEVAQFDIHKLKPFEN